MTHTHEYFMKAALRQAKRAEAMDEVPVGAVIVKDGRIVARGFNQREKTNDPTGHAEVIAIRQAARKLQSWRLSGCSLYVTIEPCSMCAGAILWSRLDRIVYGAKDPKGGALGSSYNLFEQKNLNHHPEVVEGVLVHECQALISNYFKNKRSKKKPDLPANYE
jgi:tRNA(adenine34) deaminase